MTICDYLILLLGDPVGIRAEYGDIELSLSLAKIKELARIRTEVLGHQVLEADSTEIIRDAKESQWVDSVAVQWLVPERGSAEAQAVVEQGARDGTKAMVPILLQMEASNVLHQHIRQNEIGPDEATRLIGWLSEIGLELRSELSLYPRAIALATE